MVFCKMSAGAVVKYNKRTVLKYNNPWYFFKKLYWGTANAGCTNIMNPRYLCMKLTCVLYTIQR